MGKAHTKLLNQVLMGCTSQRVRLWRNETGKCKSFDGERIISYGLQGSGDITGVARCKSGIGARIEIEIKIENDTMSIHQHNFARMIRSMGGLYIEARNLDETIDKIHEFIENH